MDPDCLTRRVSVVALSYRVSLRKLARKIDNVEEQPRRTRGASLQTAQSECSEGTERRKGVLGERPASAGWFAVSTSRLTPAVRLLAENRFGRLHKCVSALQVAGRKAANGFGNHILANGGNLSQDGGEAL